MRNKKRERREAAGHALAVKMCMPYRDQINSTPALLSLLYDIDLMPEQIRLPVNALRMIVVCDIFKKLSEADIQSLMAAA